LNISQVLLPGMAMDQQHIESLLQKFASGRISEAEQQILSDYMSTVDEPLFKQLMEQHELTVQTQGVPGEPDEVLYQRIQQRIAGIASQDGPVIRRRWYMAAAAAILLLVIAGGAYRYFRQEPQQPVIVSHAPEQDALPGGNKAVLTLADGSQVKLDSAGNQVIAQGSTAIQQQHGQLQYTVQKTAEVNYHTLSTPRGGQFQLLLPDGTRVWLNAASVLRYPTAFVGAERVVELQGQGYFEVAKNADQPFKVVVKEMEVQVLGTAFDIMAYPEEGRVNTTLQEGAVRVKHGEAAKLLKPGQQAVLNTAGHLAVQEVDVDQTIAWKTGFFEFDNEQLSVIMRQIARWYDVEVDYSEINDRKRFGGRISRNLPLSQVLRILEANGAVFRLEGKVLKVVSK